jgi:hypothetical protein
MRRLLVALVVIISSSARADLRLKVRSTPFFDIDLTLGETHKDFSSGESPKEQIFYLPTAKIANGSTLQICYTAKKHKGVPNAKNLALVHLDYLGKGLIVQNLRSVSPTANDYSAGKKSCDRYHFRQDSEAGVDAFEITAIEEPNTILPHNPKVFEPIAPPASADTKKWKTGDEVSEDDIHAAEAMVDMMSIHQTTGGECKKGSKVVNCAEAIPQMKAGLEEMKKTRRVPASLSED